MVLYLFLSGVLLTHLRRPVSRLTVSEQQLEGEFRYVNSRLITNAEEVAFYRGNQREKRTMLTAFNRLVFSLPFEFSSDIRCNQFSRVYVLLFGVSGQPLAPLSRIPLHNGICGQHYR